MWLRICMLTVVLTSVWSLAINEREEETEGNGFQSKLDNRLRQARFNSMHAMDRGRQYPLEYDPRSTGPYAATNTYKFKPLELIKPVKAVTASPVHQGTLTLYDYKSIWTDMLEEIYKILQDRLLLREGAITTKIITFLFQMLKEIKHHHKDAAGKDPHCPEIYTEIEGLCLCIDFLEEPLDFKASRDYCKAYKGGDLAIIRDPDDFYIFTSFFLAIDSNYERNYWTSFKKTVAAEDWEERLWRQIDGTAFPSCVMWGNAEENDAADDLTTREFAIFNATEFWYITSTEEEDAEAYPFCQFIASRDKDNFHYGEGVGGAFYDWKPWFEWAAPPKNRPLGNPGFMAGSNPHSALSPGEWKRNQGWKRSLDSDVVVGESISGLHHGDLHNKEPEAHQPPVHV